MKENEPKASDLMVGDLVLGCIEGERVGVAHCKIPCWVVETHKNGDYSCQPITGLPDGIELEDGDDFSWCEPIPLTPEILEKNGFEKREVRILAGSKTHYCIVDDYFALAINEHTDSIWEVEYTNTEAHFPLIRNLVCYVHELQHALRLCGIEKEITL